MLTIATELDDKNIARISHEEFRLLRETSERVEKLIERNVHLSDELEKWKEIASEVQGLEKENKRLAGDLAKMSKQQQQDVGTPKPGLQSAAGSKSTTPAPSDPRSSAAGLDGDESKTMVTKEKYQSLIAKYNIIYEQLTDMRDARQTMVDALRVRVNTIKEWEKWQKIQSETVSKKNDKIQRLEEEIQRLRAQLNGKRGLPMAPLPRTDATQVPFVPASSPVKDHDVETLAEKVGGTGVQLDQPMFRLLKPDVDNADKVGEVTRVVQVPASSPSKALKFRASRKETGRASQIHKAADPPADQGSPAPEEPDLPARHRGADTRVEDTEFEPIESHHTSSTEGSDPLSPSKAPGYDQVPLGKPAVEHSSSPVIEFISARNVKKRKLPHDSQTIKTKVKVETISSSPIGLARLQSLNSNESLDLDDIGEKVDTPKKQRRVVQLTLDSSRSVSLSPLAARLQSQHEIESHSNAPEDGQSGNTSQETPIRRRDSVLQPRSTNRQILPRTSEDRAPKRRRIASDEAVGELVEDGEIAAVAQKSRRQTAHTNHHDLLGGLLAKPSPPKQVLSPRLAGVSDQQLRTARMPVTSGLAREFQHLPQDRQGGDYAQVEDTPRIFPSQRKGRESAESSRPSSKGSSHRDSVEPILPSSRTSLMGSAEPSRPTSKDTSTGSIEPPRPTSKGTSRGFAAPPQSSSAQTTYLPPKRPPLTTEYFAKASPRTPAKSSRLNARQSAGSSKATSTKSCRSGNNDASDWEMDPDQVPLRVRPVSRLKLSDFKVNLNYNQGYNYAFNEVVRGHAARQCLQGCTKPECCGHQFRVLAEMNQEARGPPTLSQEEADEMLLDEYLGDSAYKIRNMSKEQKEELLLQAKTRDLANKYGRHRLAYERRPSPPGFWRADFPTTQEEREDREKSRKIESDAVEERYKEAMRPNGRFIFRDE